MGMVIAVTQGFCEAARDCESSLFRAWNITGAQRMLTAASPLAASGEPMGCWETGSALASQSKWQVPTVSWSVFYFKPRRACCKLCVFYQGVLWSSLLGGWSECCPWQGVWISLEVLFTTFMGSELGTLTPGFGQWSHQLWSLQPGAKKAWGLALWPSPQEIMNVKHFCTVPGLVCTQSRVLSVAMEMYQGLTLCQALCSGFFIHYLILTFQRIYKAILIIPILQRRKLRLGDTEILAHDNH